MKVEIRFRNLEPSDALREYVSRRAHMHLSRFGGEITRVVARIADTNGPRGGVDMRCHLMVTGPKIGTVSLEELSIDAYAAADQAIDRISLSLGRHLERVRSRPAQRVGHHVTSKNSK